LSLIELEVLEARRSVTEFQKTPKALTQHLLNAIPAGTKSDIEAVLDLGILTDELVGAGAWSKMNDAERNQMSSAYRRALHEIVEGYGSQNSRARMRLLHLEEKDNSAEAICLLAPYDVLVKLRLIRRDNTWYLVELVQSDVNLHSVAEAVRPTISSIENARAGRKIVIMPTDVTRVLLLRRTNIPKALEVAEGAVKTKPSDPNLRFLKALTLLDLAKKKDEAIELLRELSNEGYVPAVYKLADELYLLDDEKKKAEAVTLYKRYTELEPYDPRGFRDLAAGSDNANQPAEAEAAYRKSIELNPASVGGYVDFITFLIIHDRMKEVRPWLETAEKLKDDGTDVFGTVMESFDLAYAEKFAAAEPSRMKASFDANLALGRMYSEAERYPAALGYLQTAARLDKTTTDAHILIAYVHRKQKRYNAALRAAQQAIAIDDSDGDARYELACALARLGRIKEAMTTLEKALETSPDHVLWMADEADLKPLAHLPAFKKLLQTEKQ
jgi:tetratricopeptide (TPR) repeat protein